MTTVLNLRLGWLINPQQKQIESMENNNISIQERTENFSIRVISLLIYSANPKYCYNIYRKDNFMGGYYETSLVKSLLSLI